MTPALPRLTLGRLEALARSSDELRTLVGYLRDEGYTLERIGRSLGVSEPPAVLLSKTALYSHLLADERSDGSSTLDALVQLFFLGGRLPARAFTAAIAPSTAALLERHGLVGRDADGVVEASVSLVELESCLLFADKLFRNLGGGRIVMAADPVMPMHASSCELYFDAAATGAMGSFLDVGCGSGCQALLAAARYRRVVGFDLDPRAVGFARLNAQANGRRVDFTVADALRFADGTRYDRIVFNADSIPDFRSPKSTRVGYELALEVLGMRLEPLLAPGGICQVWCIFFVAERFDSLPDLLAQCLPGAARFDIAATVLERSPFAVSADELRRGTVPRGCYLANDETDRRLLLDFARRTRTREIVVARLSLTLRS